MTVGSSLWRVGVPWVCRGCDACLRGGVCVVPGLVQTCLGTVCIPREVDDATGFSYG